MSCRQVGLEEGVVGENDDADKGTTEMRSCVGINGAASVYRVTNKLSRVSMGRIANEEVLRYRWSE